MKHSIEIDGLPVSYSDSGPKEAHPVILMHGWGCTSATVQSIAKALDHKLRVISLDLPGHGDSPEPPLLPDGSPWGVYEYADMIEKLIDKLGLENPSLIGHSYGGRVAIVVASHRNDMKQVTLVDSAGIKPKRRLPYYIKVYSYKTMKKLLPAVFGKESGGRMLEKWRGKVGSADYRLSSPVMRMIMSKSVNQDLRKHLPGIKAPTLLIWGEKDTATPLSDARIMEKMIPDSGLVVFENCSHYSFLDNPARFRAVIQAFYKL